MDHRNGVPAYGFDVIHEAFFSAYRAKNAVSAERKSASWTTDFLHFAQSAKPCGKGV
jgi:hypothetical protein